MHHLLAEQQRALLFCKEDKLGLAGQGGAGPQAHRERERHLFVWFGLTPSGIEEKKTQRAGWLDLTSTAGKTLLQSPSLEKLENHKIK